MNKNGLTKLPQRIIKSTMSQSVIQLTEAHKTTYDQQSFTTPHTLVGDPQLSMDSLAALIQRLPKEQVFFSSGSVSRNADFDRASIEHKSKFSLGDALKDFA